MAALAGLVALLLLPALGPALTAMFRRWWGDPYTGVHGWHGLTWFWSVDRYTPAAALAFWLAAALGFALIRLVGPSALGARLSRLWPTRHFRLAVAALVVPFLWYFRLQIALGDSTRYTAQLGTGDLFIMHGPLGSLYFAGLHRLLGSAWPPEATVSLANCLLGGLWVYGVLALAAAQSGWPRWLLLAAVLPAGGAALFFGYREMMAAPLAFGLLYLLAALRALRGGSILPAALFLGTAVGSHGQAIILAPSFLLLLSAAWRRGERRPLRPALLLAAAPVLVPLALALLQPDRIIGGLYGDALGGPSGMFVTLSNPSGEYERYTLFSRLHWMDLANELWVVAPLLPLVLPVALLSYWPRRKDVVACFLAAVAVPALLLFLLWNPDLGILTDWDLFVPPLLLLLATACLLWPEHLPLDSAWAGAAAGVSLVGLALWLARFEPALTWDPWHSVWVQVQQRTSARFDQQVDLIGFTGPAGALAPGDTASYTLFWRARRPLAVDYTVGLFLVDQRGSAPVVIAQDDHQPVTWYRLMSQWAPGEVVGDTHVLPLPASLTPGTYAVWVVVYNLDTLTRLPLHGHPARDYFHLADLSVASAP